MTIAMERGHHQGHPQAPTSAADAPSAPASPMQMYRCPWGHYLFASDGTWGRVRVRCRRCKTNHTFFLGGYQRLGDQAAGVALDDADTDDEG